MLAVTKQKINLPCYSNKAPDVAFEEVPLPDAEESETSVGHLFLSSLKLQLGPVPLVP